MPGLAPLTRQILNILLDRFERPKRQTVVRVRLKEINDYASGPRAETHAALTNLASQNLIHLQWVKHEAGNWLEAVDLIPEQATAIYQLLQRAPRAAREHTLRNLLNAQSPQSSWHADFLEWTAKQLDEHRSVAPLDLDDPDSNADFLRALTAVANLRAPVLERALSVQLFSNSKRLETLRGKLITVLRRFDSVETTFIDDDDAILRLHWLERTPEYVPVSGPLVLQSGAMEMDVGAFTPSVALSALMLRQARVVRVPARHVVTIENATSFSEAVVAQSVPPESLLIFTGGFSSPTIIQLLQAMRAAQTSLQFWHWGDMDVGGLRIFAHLRSQVDSMQPLGMDSETFESHRAYAQPLSQKERDSLLALASLPLLSDCFGLIDAMLAASQKLEQEAIRPTEAFVQIK